MSNLINYYSHKLYKLPFYHRQIDNDIESSENLVARVSKIGFQFIFLYKPAANICNFTLSIIRVTTNFSKCISRIENQDFDENILSDAYVTSISIITLAATYFNSTIGIYLTTLSDISINLEKIYHALEMNDYEMVFELVLQLISSILQLEIMLSGSLEIILASLVTQAVGSLFQASKEFKKGRYLEGLANIILATLKLGNASDQLLLIKKRNTFLKIQKYNELIARIKKSKDIDDLYNHPLIRLVDEINNKKAILKDCNDNEIDFGSHFFGYGKKQVKGMNLSFKQKDDFIELEFKVNHVFRDKIAKLVKDLKSYESADLNDLLKIFGSHASTISVDREDSLAIDSYYKPKDIVINVKDIAKVSIGESKNIIGLYDRVKICFEKNKNLYDLHEVLSFFDLTDVIRTSTNEDLERMKIGQVFRMCAPKEATQFERTDEFFYLPIDRLKQKVIEIVPGMENNFQKYLPRFELKELIPGKLRYAIKGLSDELYELGARNITSVITGAYSDRDLCNRIVSIFKMGALSTESRHYAGLIPNGLSPITDFKSGGSDSIFTQIITKNNQSYNDMWYSGKVRLLYSLKALDTISYQYDHDSSGNRSLDSWWWGSSYLNRPSIFDFVRRETDNYIGSNEIMIKERIAPEHIEGIVVQSQRLKDRIIDSLQNANLITVDDVGNRTIFGKALDIFIKVGSSIS